MGSVHKFSVATQTSLRRPAPTGRRLDQRTLSNLRVTALDTRYCTLAAAALAIVSSRSDAVRR